MKLVEKDLHRHSEAGDVVVTGQRAYYTGGSNPYSSYNGSSDPRFQQYMAWEADYAYAYHNDTLYDRAASDAASLIKQKADSNKIEYSAFIYKDSSGSVHTSKILRGDDHSVGSHTLQEYGIPNGSTLEGFIHNHPTLNADGQMYTNRALPDNYDLNALVNASGYAQRGNFISVDQSNFRSYIMHDSVVDEYDYLTHVGNYPTDHGTVVYSNIPIDHTSPVL